ncbi:transmembrane protein 26-like isoform X2 [Mizuhopecten yessoensis]|uniref:transmembrane protein 26-like isoform X2 n=1 Tax=Mizuhopecten yessoensis TaxID=6573 RepID=UPI000B45E050|nr:transmembrane protein 26-like isoform X2 [Mizuhopecten yessoensis]
MSKLLANEYNNPQFWLMSLGVVLVALEGYITIRVNKGIEWKRLCPCFAIYLVITLPSIWLLEISQMNKYMESQAGAATAANVTMAPTTVQTVTSGVTRTMTTALAAISSTHGSNVSATMATTASNISDIVNATIATAPSNASEMLTNNTTDLPTIRFTNTTSAGIIANIEILLDSFNADTWLVVVEESLVYLIVIGRWLLPRGRVTREELSDLLFDYLAMASDIMELLALFDEDSIRGNPTITYAILAIWSLSFIQFIPVVMNRRAVNSFTQHTQDKKDKSNWYVRAGCGNSFPDIFVTIAGLFLQDGPFLGLRLFIIFYLQLLTYSLVFFVLKNTIVVLLLTYRLGILCFNLPCFSRRDASKECMEELDMDDPLDFGEEILKKNDLKTSDNGITNNGFQDQSAFGESDHHDHNKMKNCQPQNGHMHGDSIGENPVSGNPVNGVGLSVV